LPSRVWKTKPPLRLGTDLPRARPAHQRWPALRHPFRHPLDDVRLLWPH